jgi:hypothetical protein
MQQNQEDTALAELLDKKNYAIDSLDTEIKADRYCGQLLKHFHRWLLNDQHKEALEAGRMAAGADYFLREFMIGSRRDNIFSATAEQLRQFGGNWYIINNLEPNSAELEPMLLGAAFFYRYSVEQNLCSPADAEAIDAVAHQSAYFKGRIEDFHQLKDDGYSAWDQACSLK